MNSNKSSKTENFSNDKIKGNQSRSQGLDIRKEEHRHEKEFYIIKRTFCLCLIFSITLILIIIIKIISHYFNKDMEVTNYISVFSNFITLGLGYLWGKGGTSK